MRIPDKATSYEITLAKWLLFILAIVVLLFWLKGWNKCRTICEDKGFIDYQYSHGSRYEKSSCHCFTQEELPIKKDNTTNSGTRVF